MGTVVRKGPSLESVAVALEGMGDLQGKVGWFETAVYPDGTPVAYVATIHEFGAPSAGIPARPFMRPAVARFGAEWQGLVAKGAEAAIAGTVSPRDVLEALTMRAAGDVAKSLAGVEGPPLAPATIKRKGHDKPLVDTGLMGQTIQGVVE